MDTQRGREAFLTVKALGANQDWSFGYHKTQVDPPSEELRAKGVRRVLSKLGPISGRYEVSPVPMGGGIGTRTLAAKAMAEVEAKAAPMASVDGTEHPASDFAYVPDEEKPSTWRFPIFNEAHVRDALARFSQADLPSADKAAVLARIHEAAKKFGIDVAGEKKSAEATSDVEHKMALIGASLRHR